MVDRLEFKVDRADGYITDQRRRHIYVYDIAEEKLVQITSGDYDHRQPSWSPDGKAVAFTSNRSKHPDRNYNTDIWLVSAETTDKDQQLTQLTTHPGPDSSPVWSPDGKWIAYTTASDGEYGVSHLAIIPHTGGTAKILTKELDGNVYAFEFSADGDSIFFIYTVSGAQHLGAVPSKGGPVRRLITGPRVVNSFSLGKNNILAANITPANGTEELYSFDNKQLRKLTHVNDELLSQLKLGELEKVRFTSRDGTEIESFVVKPPDFDPSQKYSTLLSVHGGPVGQYTWGYSFSPQFYAAQGYVVVLPNPRGSTGRGEKFTKAIFQGWGFKDYEDVLAAVTVIPTVFAFFAGQNLAQEKVLDIMAQGNEGLTFKWIPILFSKITSGTFFLALFFLALCFAAFSSLIAQLELVTRIFMDSGLHRKKAVKVVGICCFVLGIPSAISMGFFKNQDWVWGMGLIVSGSFFLMLVLKVGPRKIREEIITRPEHKIRLGRWFDYLIKFILPLQLIAMLVWWFWDSYSSDPENWLNIFARSSIGTVLFQWAVALAIFIVFNRIITKKLFIDNNRS